MALTLFGDYEQIIDRCLGGDLEIKRRVAEADAQGRRGLAVLKYQLGKHAAQLPPDIARIMETCEKDQEYYDQIVRHDFRNIETRGSKYRLSVTFEWNRYRRTFETVGEARRCRDQLHVLFESLAQAEAWEEGLER